jgi:hypothetical protein
MSKYKGNDYREWQLPALSDATDYLWKQVLK